MAMLAAEQGFNVFFKYSILFFNLVEDVVKMGMTAVTLLCEVANAVQHWCVCRNVRIYVLIAHSGVGRRNCAVWCSHGRKTYYGAPRWSQPVVEVLGRESRLMCDSFTLSLDTSPVAAVRLPGWSLLSGWVSSVCWHQSSTLSGPFQAIQASQKFLFVQWTNSLLSKY